MLRFPNATVRLAEVDKVPWAVLGATVKALAAAGAPEDEVRAFVKEAISGDYRHLVDAVAEWVTVR